MTKVNKNLSLFSALLLLWSIMLFSAIQKFSPLIGHVTYFCKSFIETYVFPIPYYLNIIPFAFLFIILAISLTKLFFLSIKIRRLRNSLNKNLVKYRFLNSLIDNLGLKDKIVIVKSIDRFAFCLGIRTPKIYISTGIVHSLSIKEMEAVLRHEQYHLENRDTFTMVIASVSCSLFPFFPLLGDLIRKYRVERELKADKYAIAKVGESKPLISALNKLLSFPTVQAVPVAAIADQDTLEARIYALVGEKYIQPKLKKRNLMFTVLFLILIAVSIVMPVQAREIHHENYDILMVCTNEQCMNSCATSDNLNKIYSEINKSEAPISSNLYTPAK